MTYGRHDEIWSIDLSLISPTPTTTENTSPSPPSPPTSTTMDPSLFTCDNKPDGFYPHPLDFVKFIGCHNGTTDYYTCQPPLLFNPIKSTCDSPNAVN